MELKMTYNCSKTLTYIFLGEALTMWIFLGDSSSKGFSSNFSSSPEEYKMYCELLQKEYEDLNSYKKMRLKVNLVEIPMSSKTNFNWRANFKSNEICQPLILIFKSIKSSLKDFI